jgi:predicted  nucleic acid-binding Zn-ribbon protein
VDNLDAVSPASVDPEEVAQLRDELEEEKLVSGQLEERNKKLREKYDAAREALEAELETQRMATAKLDMEMQRMRAANEQLRSSNAALREANEKGVGEPHLINKAMLAELEGLRASRAVDRAEAEAIAETIGLALNGQLPQLEENV